MDIQQDLWYDLPELLPQAISGRELSELLETVNSAGWAVFKKIRDLEARNSACVALNLASPPEQQQAHRALWIALAQDIAFGGKLKELAATAEGCAKDALGLVDEKEEAPIPSVIEFKNFTNKPDKQ